MERNTFGLVWTITEERKRLEEKEKKNQDG